MNCSDVKPIAAILRKWESLRALMGWTRLFVPPGHFYSPIPGAYEMELLDKRLSKSLPDNIAGIDLNFEGQRSLLEPFKEYYRELPFPASKDPDFRYYYENPNYLYSDAIFLYCVIRHFKPKNIIEIGSGFSSCCVLDTNERFFADAICCSFIEPQPKLLYSLMRAEDRSRSKILPIKIQEVDIELFDQLRNDDLLIIDSTHVVKTGSDVNYIFSDILPRLKKGVLIHFHDIFYPFEYPKEWVREGRAWNEAYMLRTFLQFNEAFRIVFFNTFMEIFLRDFFVSEMPLCLKNTGGSVWIRKVSA